MPIGTLKVIWNRQVMYNAALPANPIVLTSYSEDMIEVAYHQTGIFMEIQSPLIKIICQLSSLSYKNKKDYLPAVNRNDTFPTAVKVRHYTLNITWKLLEGNFL